MNYSPEKIISLIDLTSLGDHDTQDHIALLCQRARQYNPAALCIWPHFIAQAKLALKDSGIKLATVVNFPAGCDTPDQVSEAVDSVRRQGADEIDLVFPWRAFLAEDMETPLAVLRAGRTASSGLTLKVILESGVFPDAKRLESACGMAIAEGADFIKTSTGKIVAGATPGAARTIVRTIRKSGKKIGFKASGGIRDAATASLFIRVAEEIMGEGWATPDNLRLGASSLLDALIAAQSVRFATGFVSDHLPPQ